VALWHAAVLFAGAAAAEGLTRRMKVIGYKSPEFRAGKTSFAKPVGDIIAGEVILGKAPVK